MNQIMSSPISNIDWLHGLAMNKIHIAILFPPGGTTASHSGDWKGGFIT